jgi:hypothetical protein
MMLMDWHLCIYSYGQITLAIAFCFSVLLQPIPELRCVLRFKEARQHFLSSFKGGEQSGSHGLGGVSDFILFIANERSEEQNRNQDCERQRLQAS